MPKQVKHGTYNFYHAGKSYAPGMIVESDDPATKAFPGRFIVMPEKAAAKGAPAPAAGATASSDLPKPPRGDITGGPSANTMKSESDATA